MITSETPTTRRQREVLRFIESFIAEHGYAPSVREIGSHLNIRSPNGLKYHLDALRKRGLITWEKGLSRTLQVVRKDSA